MTGAKFAVSLFSDARRTGGGNGATTLEVGIDNAGFGAIASVVIGCGDAFGTGIGIFALDNVDLETVCSVGAGTTAVGGGVERATSVGTGGAVVFAGNTGGDSTGEDDGDGVGRTATRTGSGLTSGLTSGLAVAVVPHFRSTAASMPVLPCSR